MGTETQLKGVSEYGNPLQTERIAHNTVEFFRWGLLCVGAWTAVAQTGVTGAYGQDYSRLRPSSDPNYGSGIVWESARRDWIWEQNINYHHQPFRPSGIWVNGVFQADSGQFHVDYQNGRLIMNSPLPVNSVVQTTYCFCNISVSNILNPTTRRIMFDTLRNDAPQFLQYGSGVWDRAPDTQLQLPHIVIEPLPSFSQKGYELGSQGLMREQQVGFHVLAQSNWEAGHIADIIANQENKTIIHYDPVKAFEQNKYAFDIYGSPLSGCVNYAQRTGDQALGIDRMTFLKMRGHSISNEPPLFRVVVQATIELTTPRV